MIANRKRCNPHCLHAPAPLTPPWFVDEKFCDMRPCSAGPALGLPCCVPRRAPFSLSSQGDCRCHMSSQVRPAANGDEDRPYVRPRGLFSKNSAETMPTHIRGCTLGGKLFEDRESAILGSGRPRSPVRPLQKVVGFASHLLQGSPGPPGPPRLPK
jgi:hypothetical protein